MSHAPEGGNSPASHSGDVRHPSAFVDRLESPSEWWLYVVQESLLRLLERGRVGPPTGRSEDIQPSGVAPTPQVVNDNTPAAASSPSASTGIPNQTNNLSTMQSIATSPAIDTEATSRPGTLLNAHFTDRVPPPRGAGTRFIVLGAHASAESANGALGRDQVLNAHEPSRPPPLSELNSRWVDEGEVEPTVSLRMRSFPPPESETQDWGASQRQRRIYNSRDEDEEMDSDIRAEPGSPGPVPGPPPEHQVQLAATTHDRGELFGPGHEAVAPVNTAQVPDQEARNWIISLQNELAAVRQRLDEEKMARAAAAEGHMNFNAAWQNILAQALANQTNAHHVSKDEILAAVREGQRQAFDTAGQCRIAYEDTIRNMAETWRSDLEQSKVEIIEAIKATAANNQVPYTTGTQGHPPSSSTSPNEKTRLSSPWDHSHPMNPALTPLPSAPFLSEAIASSSVDPFSPSEGISGMSSDAILPKSNGPASPSRFHGIDAPRTQDQPGVSTPSGRAPSMQHSQRRECRSSSTNLYGRLKRFLDKSLHRSPPSSLAPRPPVGIEVAAPIP